MYARVRWVFGLFLLLSLFLGCASGGGSDGEGGGNGGGGSSAGGNGDGSGQFRFARCGTSDPDHDALSHISSLFQSFRKNIPLLSALKADSIVEIPVHFHIISRGPSVEDGEIPDSMCLSQIDVLNHIFSGGSGGIETPFRFRLAGINRVRNADWYTVAPGSQVEIDMKTALHRGGPETLNIYTANIEDQILGYSSLPFLLALIPTLDGIVINFRTLPQGSLNRYNTGYVLGHEAGHWLGLFHTFQGGCDGFFDDLVEDTPRELVPGEGEFCPENRDSCPNVSGKDPIHNHMTYTVDSCRSEFTAGQLQFIKFNLMIFRGISF